MKLNEKLRSIKHILFDYDGLLVDSEKVYYQTWCSILNEEGQLICKEFHKGRHEFEVFQKIKPYIIGDLSLEQVSHHREIMFNKIVANEGLDLIPNVRILLEALKRRISLSIVSNSDIKTVNSGLEATGIKSYFSDFFCFDSTVRRKPMPDLYLRALAGLRLSCSDAIAIEDSISGLESALNANITVVCINKDRGMRYYCDLNRISYFESPDDLSRFIENN